MVTSTSTPPVSQALWEEFTLVEQIISFRIEELCNGAAPQAMHLPTPAHHSSHPYLTFLRQQPIKVTDRLALDLALMSQLEPHRLDELFTRNQDTAQPFTEFGVLLEGEPKRLTPSWQTAFFLSHGQLPGLTGDEWQHLQSDYLLYKNKILEWTNEPIRAPWLRPLTLTGQTLRNWLSLPELAPEINPFFPATRLQSNLSWSDLFLATQTQSELQELRLWLQHGEQLLADPQWAKHVTKGVRALFYGPPGTGKTLTATLLGQAHDLPVYRIDLSQLVSKWVGETEKNLAQVFEAAQQHRWILFFDEADALFTQRSTGTQAHDRRSNQEISYLLQRIENFPGTILMATNLRDSIDEAFVRRMQHMIYFPLPDATTRVAMWQNMLRPPIVPDHQVDLKLLARKYPLSGGSMKNAFRNLLLQLPQTNSPTHTVSMADLEKAIQKEQHKAGEFRIAKRF